jgi:hypothetical protein
MSKLKLWNEEKSWEEAEKKWQENAFAAASVAPIKKLRVLPQMPGITEETKRFLKWKSFKYLFFHKEGLKIVRHGLRHPLKYASKYLVSLFKKASYKRDCDFFLYGLNSVEDFLKRVKNPKALLVVGFSYCQKPFECPSGRFSDACIHDITHPVCSQCEIGKALHALPDKTIPLLIPTIHYIGDKMFEIVHQNPKNEILFVITACEMTLEMFGDFGNMVGSKGIGIRLDGRICNTMKAFELSEKGIKPGLTVLTEETSERLFDLIRKIREYPQRR